MRWIDRIDPPTPAPKPEWPTPFAQRCFDTARARVRSVSTTSTVWLLALIFVWLAGIEPKSSDLSALRSQRRDLARRQTKRADEKMQRAALESRLAALPGLVSVDTPLTAARETRPLPDGSRVAGSNPLRAPVEPPPTTATPDTSSRGRLRAQEESVAVKKELANVAFELPGVKGAIETAYAPLAWSVLLLALVLYVLRARLQIFDLCARGLQASPPTVAPDERSDLLGDVPAWLAPLPRHPAPGITADAFREGLGWRTPDLDSRVYAWLAFALLALIQIRVAALGVIVAEGLSTGPIRGVVVPAAMFGTIGLTIVCVWRWFREGAKAPSPPATAGVRSRSERRSFVSAVVVGGVFAAAYPLWLTGGRILRRVGVNATRRRFSGIVRSARVTLDAGVFYRNTKTSTIHYAVRVPDRLEPSRQQGFATHCLSVGESHVAILNVTYVNEKAFEKLPSLPARPLQAESARPNLSSASRSFETAAMAAVLARDPNSASNLLLHAIDYDLVYAMRRGRRPSYRLYDLLAVISVRYNLPKNLAAMRSRIVGSRLPRTEHVEAIAARLEKWEKSAEWRRRWQDKNATVKWGCVLLP
jgi:hypothetical protein